MKNSFVIIILAMMASYSFSQKSSPASEFKATWGAPYEIPKKYQDQGYFMDEENGIIQVSAKYTTDVIMQRFDLNRLVPTNRVTIDLSEKPDHFVPDLFVRLKGNFYMLYSTWDKESEREHLFADKIDTKKGTFDGDPRELISADKIAGQLIATGFYKFSTAQKFNFYFSIDSSFILVTYRSYPVFKDDSKNKDDLGFYVFDNNLKKIWGGEFRMPYTEEMMDNTDYAIDSRGNAYLLCKVYQGKRTEKSKGDPNYHYEVLKFTAGSDKPKQIKMKTGDKFINDLLLFEDFEGEMICAGYYSSVYKISSPASNAKHNHADGTFIFKIDENDSLVSIRKGYYELPAELLKAFEKPSEQAKVDRKNKKDKAEAPGLYLRKVVVGDDGTITFIGEQYLHTTHTYTSSNGRTNTVDRYNYGDIYLMKINPEGDVAWVSKIPKNQDGGNGRGSMSFKYFSWHGANYFFYLDNIKNLNLSVDDVPAKHMDGAGGYLMVCKIDANGRMTKGSMLNVRDHDLMIWPADFSEVSGNTLLGRGMNGNVSKMLKIEHVE